MNLIFKTVALFLTLTLAGCGDEPAFREGAHFDNALVVLGNEPLDDLTPTVDTVARVSKAVEFYKQHPSTLLIFTGGPTAGSNTEARMMADLAIAQGVAINTVCLEEKARSTQQNARLTAGLIRKIAPQRILIVSKSDHLDWAMPLFRREEIFRTAETLACPVALADSILQMKAYLANHPDNQRVRERLQALENGLKGTD